MKVRITERFDEPEGKKAGGVVTWGPLLKGILQCTDRHEMKGFRWGGDYEQSNRKPLLWDPPFFLFPLYPLFEQEKSVHFTMHVVQTFQTCALLPLQPGGKSYIRV